MTNDDKSDVSKSPNNEVFDLDTQVTRRKFIASTAAVTGTLVLGANSVFAAGDKVAGGKTYDWAKLQANLKGDLVTASSPDWKTVLASMVWNEIKPDRAPDVIVRAKNNEDVIAAINFARENDLKVAVHGGGHTWCGLAVRNGGMTIDLTALNGCEIDAAAKKAVLQPVLSNREVAKKLGEQGLAFPIGHCPTVKVSGYLLNGGLSWNLAEWGLAVKSVEAYELVTADGKLIKATATEHPDLFWAAKGCGPGMFAVAVKYHLKCFDLPKAITTSGYWYHLDDLKEVVEKATAIAWKMPSLVEFSVFLKEAPPEIADKVKSSNGKACLVSGVAFANSPAEARAALMLLEDADLMKKCLKKNVCEPGNFESLEDASGASWPEGLRNLVENTYSNGKPVDMFMDLRDEYIKTPSTSTVIVFCLSTGGKNFLPIDPDIACSANGNYYGGLWTMWKDEKDDAANMAWHRKTRAILQKHVSGYYIGETDYVEMRDHVKGSYTAGKFKRLEEVRKKYDPNGVFQGFAGGLPPAKNA